MKKSTDLKLSRNSDNISSMNDDELDILTMPQMDMVAIELHEMHQALQRAGFSERQATEIIAFAVASGVMLPTKFIEDSPETPRDPDEGLDSI